MLVLIFVISLIIGLLCLYLTVYSEIAEAFAFLIWIICGVSGIAIFCMLLFYPYNVDEKIEMYEIENAVIEEKVKNTVRDYMEYEETTYKQLLENADLTTMVLKYPELNSNELVKMEIETYKENSKKLKELKEERIGKSRKAWWLYFGN